MMRFNPIRPAGEKVPAPILTLENFLDNEVIPTKCGHFHYNLLENKILEKFGVQGMTTPCLLKFLLF